MAIEDIIIHLNDGVLNLRMNRPKRRNALGSAMVQQLLHAWQKAEEDPNVRVIVLSSNEGPFCAGSDLKELAGLSPEAMACHQDHHAELSRFIVQSSLPSMSVIEGYALGGGLSLACSCDIVVCSENAKLAMPELSNGWVPPWGVTPLVRRMGELRTQSLCWGISMPPKVAMSHGLVDAIGQEGECLDLALNMAKPLTHNDKSVNAKLKYFFTARSHGKGKDHVQDDRHLRAAFVDMSRSETSQKTWSKFS